MRPAPVSLRRLVFTAAAGLAVAASGVVEARAAKPRVPPGRDPGGVAVALIGSGLDYRAPDIAARLARDGEGELIGWDLADSDRQPYSAANDVGLPVARLLAGSRDVRLVPVRVAAGRHDQIAAALRFAATTPARVAVIVADPGAGLPLAGLEGAARSFPQMLIIVPAGRVEERLPPATRGAGLLLVSGEARTGPSADVMVAAVETPLPRPPGGAAAEQQSDDVAALRIAALAARLAATDPALSGAAMGARILGAALPQVSGPPLIADPSGIDWRK